MENVTVYLVLAAAFGLFMAWGIGANDVANAMATSVGSRVLTIRRAVLVAAVFEFCGAVLAGGEVTATIRQGIVDTSYFADDPELLVLGMLSSLLAAGIWLLVASRRGWPVSTTHSIVGAIVGFAAVGVGVETVEWGSVGGIVMSWVVSPLMAGVVAFLIFTSVRLLILVHPDPLERARRFVPAYMFLAGFVITLVTLVKGLQHVGLELSAAQAGLVAATVGVSIAAIGKLFIGRIKVDRKAEKKFHFHTVERVFGVLMVVTACSMAFAHGSNDVANAIGPVAAVVSIAKTGVVGQSSSVSPAILLLGGAGIVVGLASYGRHVIATVGRRLTELTPSRGFAAELAAATTIVFASGTGLPISTTHTLVGAVLGVGLARGIAAIDLATVGRIFLSWIVTIPAGAFFSIVFFYVLKWTFGGLA